MFPSAPSGLSLPSVAALLLASLLSSASLPAQSLPPLSGVSVSLATSTNRVEATPELKLEEDGKITRSSGRSVARISE